MRINPFSCAQLVLLHIGFLGWSQSKHLDLIKFRLFFFGMVSRVHVCKCFVADFVSPFRNCSHAQVGDTKPNAQRHRSAISSHKKIVLLASNIGSRTQESLSVASIDMIGASGDASFFANYCLQSIMRRSLFEVLLPMKACSIRPAISYLLKSIISANHQSDGDFSIQPSKQWSKWLSFTAPELAQLQFLQHSRIAERFLPPSARRQKIAMRTAVAGHLLMELNNKRFATSC